MTSAVIGPNPVGFEIQRGSWRRAGTHRLSVGKNTGGRTSKIVGTLGTRVTCGRTGGIGRISRPESRLPRPPAPPSPPPPPPQGRPTPKLPGDRPKHLLAPTQELVLFSGTLCCSVYSRWPYSGPSRRGRSWYLGRWLG